eukprot:scaffold6334_cov137-Isochrysis_galbana.AAC.5
MWRPSRISQSLHAACRMCICAPTLAHSPAFFPFRSPLGSDSAYDPVSGRELDGGGVIRIRLACTIPCTTTTSIKGFKKKCGT